MISNPLFDLEFLSSLLERKGRTLYARVTALTKDELPIEYIEGKVTGGNINIDGNSAVRRTCSLTLVAKEVNINDYYWGLKTKIKLEIGLANDINSKYDDIIWFRQGVYVITSFNVSYGTNNYSISINGKDKMCLLNGDLGGVLPHTTDFGIEEYYDKTTGITTYNSIPIKTIIREAVQNFGGETAQNIIINDIEDAGLELLEYRGDVPLFLLRSVTSDVFTNMTINSHQPCYYYNGESWIPSTIGDNLNIIYDTLVDLEEAKQPTTIRFSLSGEEYFIAKIEYGAIPGYRLTDLTYAGDLIANVGETLISILDKIKNMLGNYEYFYNLDGKFVFQKKKSYTSIPWFNGEKGDELPVEDTMPMWSFLNSALVTSITNNPKLDNVRNDFAVWGKKKTTAGSELDIHMRYAVDVKPERYTTLRDGLTYVASEKRGQKDTIVFCDWREIIYQMALDYRKFYHDDDFLYNVAQANKQWELYIDGHTGYEQYYTDMEGFWRLLYDPDPDPLYGSIESDSITNTDIYIQQAYQQATAEDLKNLTYKDVYVIKEGQMYPFTKGYCKLKSNEIYYYFNTTGSLDSTSWDGKNDKDTHKAILNSINIENIYIVETAPFYTSNNLPFKVLNDNNEDVPFEVLLYEVNTVGGNAAQRFVEVELLRAIDKGVTLYMRKNESDNYIHYNDLAADCKQIYYQNGKFLTELSYTDVNNFGEYKDNVITEKVHYYQQYYEYDKDTYWATKVTTNPESLLFWFDFLDADSSEIGKFSTRTIGIRSKAINDNDVKSIYYREIPQVIFQTGIETYEHQTGYTYVQLQNTMENLFTISSKGKSAKERIEELLYTHGYCSESISLTTLPVYHLEPNSRIKVQDENSGISGEYLVNKITIPLTYNGTMSITATKAVSDIT